MAPTLIAVADSVFPNLEPTGAVFEALGGELRLSASRSAEDILAVAENADALMVTFAQITAEVIAGMPRCKAIGRFGIGVDNIDLEAATAAGIQVCYVPDYCVDEVSDHAMSLLLSLARKITAANNMVQTGTWSAAQLAPVFRLRGRIMGLLGLGKIPQALVPKAQAFGLEVIAHDPFVPEDVATDLGVELVDFETLLARSDYISAHAPLTDSTHHLFSDDAFKRMKPDALLINTARGPLVDEVALARALDAGEIGGAGLDVLAEEPPGKDNPLLHRNNVILTPHAAFYSEEALIELQTKAAQDVVSVLRGEVPRYPVNQLAE